MPLRFGGNLKVLDFAVVGVEVVSHGRACLSLSDAGEGVADGQPPGFGGLLVCGEGCPVAGEFGGGAFDGRLGHAG